MWLCADTVAEMSGLPASLLPLMVVTIMGQIAELLLTQITIRDQRGFLLLKVVLSKAVLSLT